MSATLDAAPVAAYLGAARVIRNEGRQYPLEIEYTPHSAAPVEERVAGALDRLASRDTPGIVLAFLPGAPRSVRAQTACASDRAAAGVGAASAVRRPIVGGAGSRGRDGGGDEGDPGDQRGGKLDHD